MALIAVPAATASTSARAALRVVYVNAASAGAAQAAATDAGLTVLDRWDAIDAVAAAGDDRAISAVMSDRRVHLVESDQPMRLHLTTALRAIRADVALETFRGPRDLAYDGSGVSIAVIDTGVDGTHPMLQRNGATKVVRNLKVVCPDHVTATQSLAVCTSDPTNRLSRTVVDVPSNDSDSPAGGHGTHVAGIAAGSPVTTRDGASMRGVAPGASLVGLSVDPSSSGFVWAGISALHWVLENAATPCGRAVSATCPPIRVINNSWGYHDEFSPEGALAKVVARLTGAGIVIAWSAGNGGGTGEDEATTNDVTHLSTPGLISVAAYDDGDAGSAESTTAGFSSRGLKGKPATYPDVAAPGASITSACRAWLAICSTGGDPRGDPDYNTISGTSMAAPMVAGAAAVLLQAQPRLTPGAIERVLEDTAVRYQRGAPYEPDPANPGSPTSPDKGHGLIDLTAALARVLGRDPPARPDPPEVHRPGTVVAGDGYEWDGGPLTGLAPGRCDAPRIGECEVHLVRLRVPPQGARLGVSLFGVDPPGSALSLTVRGPDGGIVGRAGGSLLTGARSLEVVEPVRRSGTYAVVVTPVRAVLATYAGMIDLTPL